jgi:SAM-dependent methyltransferase
MNDPALSRQRAILERVGAYYARTLSEFGATPRGVDWNSAESQRLRFAQLARLFDGDPAAGVIDYGCGYGALAEYLDEEGRPPRPYRGFDIAAAMIDEAIARHAGQPHRTFTATATSLGPAPYVVASGIFNVRPGIDDAEWREYVLQTLQSMHDLSSSGFAFNMLTTYSDLSRRRADLHYADPREIFDHCKRRFSPRVALLHDYPLYEFTILVRK